MWFLMSPYNLDLGAGKTTLARGFVLCKLGVDEAQAQGHALRVTSPTYLLSNTYFYSDENSDQEQEYVLHVARVCAVWVSNADFFLVEVDSITWTSIDCRPNCPLTFSLCSWGASLMNVSRSSILFPPCAFGRLISCVVPIRYFSNRMAESACQISRAVTFVSEPIGCDYFQCTKDEY